MKKRPGEVVHSFVEVGQDGNDWLVGLNFLHLKEGPCVSLYFHTPQIPGGEIFQPALKDNIALPFSSEPRIRLEYRVIAPAISALYIRHKDCIVVGASMLFSTISHYMGYVLVNNLPHHKKTQ